MNETYEPEAPETTAAIATLTGSGASTPATSTERVDASPRSFDFEAAFSKAAAPPDQGLIDQFVGLKTQEREAFTQQQQRNERRAEEDRQRTVKAYNAESATIDSTPKWDAEAEKAKYKTNPMEEFGSFAFAFAMIASAFTRTPMENALNAGAAAINAKRDRNDMEYDRAFDAWKANTDLVVKRFNMQHAALGDAFTIMQTDAQRGNARLQETLTKYGMEKELLLYQNGMIPEIQQAQQAQLKAIEGIQRTQMDVTRARETERHNKAMEGRQSPDQEFVAKWKEEHPEGTSEEFAKAFDTYKQGQRAGAAGSGRPLSPDQEFVQKWKTENPNGTAAEFAKAVGEFKTNQHVRKDPTLTGAGLRADTIKKVAAPEIAKLDPADPEYDAKLSKIMLEASGKVTQAYASRGFTNNDIATLEAAPTLMKHLRTLDMFANGVIGFGRGVPVAIAAEYFGINDPAQLYHAAHAGAEKAMTDLETGKRVSTQGVKKALATLPTTLTDQRFGRVQIQQAMADLVDQSKTFIGAMDSSGKRVPEWTLDQYAKFGVFTPSKRDQDPLLKFRADPTSIGKDELKDLATFQGRLPIKDQQAIKAELLRRQARDRAAQEQ